MHRSVDAFKSTFQFPSMRLLMICEKYARLNKQFIGLGLIKSKALFHSQSFIKIALNGVEERKKNPQRIFNKMQLVN